MVLWRSVTRRELGYRFLEFFLRLSVFNQMFWENVDKPKNFSMGFRFAMNEVEGSVLNFLSR